MYLTKHPWHLLRSGPGNAAFNMAMDHALMENAATLGAPVLRFYGWSEPAASFGYFQKYSEIERATLLRPLVRRPTGGGLVPHDADWTYSIAIPPDAPWYGLQAIESYRRVHEWICAAFLKIGISAELADCCRKSMPGQCFVGHEKFDVLWHGKKIAGAAQRRTKDALLIQGSVQPPPMKIARADWELAMRDVAESEHGISWSDLIIPAPMSERAAELALGVYSQPEHNQRR